MKNLLYVFVAVAAVYLIYTNKDSIIGINDNVKQLERDADSLRLVISDLKAKQVDYDNELKALNDSINDLQNVIDNRENRIAELKRRTNEKVNNVPKYTATTNDIFKFLSDRYAKADSAANVK